MPQRTCDNEKVSLEQGQEALARTQVYLSKTKLGNYMQVSSSLYTKSTRRMMMSQQSRMISEWSHSGVKWSEQ